MSRDQKNLYLTFDDGPIPNLTEWVLDELKKYDAKATFFCVGANVVRNNKIFERLKQEGHQVANHTMFHSKGFKMNTLDYLKEVDDCEQFTTTKLFRPPYGQLKKSQYRALIKKGYKIIMWDVISYDYETIPEETVLRNVIKNSKNGSIVLFHDNIKAERNLKFTLPLFLEHYTKQGFSFQTL